MSLIQLEGLGAAANEIDLTDLLGLGESSQLVQLPQDDMGGFGYAPAFGDDDDDDLDGFGAADGQADDLGFLSTLIKVAGGAVGQAFGIPAPIGAAAAGMLESGIKGMVSPKSSAPQKVAAAKQVEQAAATQLHHLDALQAKLKRTYRRLRSARRLSRKRLARLRRAYRATRIWKKRTKRARRLARVYRARYGKAKRQVRGLQGELQKAENEKMMYGMGGVVLGGGLGLLLAGRR